MRQQQRQSQKLSRQTHFTHYFNVNSSTFTFHNIPIRWNSLAPSYSLRVRVYLFLCISFGSHQLHLLFANLSDHSVCAVQWAGKIFILSLSSLLSSCVQSTANKQVKRNEEKKTEQNHTNAMRIYLRICVMHFLSSQFLLFFRSWEMMNTVAVAALLPPANYLPFLSPWCVRVRVFLHLIFFRGRLLSNEIFHRLMHVYVDQAIRMMKTKKPVTFWKMFWEEYLVYACECVRVCTRSHWRCKVF